MRKVEVPQIVQRPQIPIIIPLEDVCRLVELTHPIEKEKLITISNFQPNITEEPETKNDKKQKVRRTPSKWSIEEQEFLLNGYRKFANCWTQILKEYPMSPIRIRFDLKDKWKNLAKKSSEPECEKVFKNVDEYKDRRNANLSLGAQFFMPNSEHDPKKREKDTSAESIQKIKSKMEEIIPRRHQACIFLNLENQETQAAVIREWSLVEENPAKVFEFIEKFRK